MDFEARVGFMPVKGLTFAIGGYSGKLGKDIEGSATPASTHGERLDALVAYVERPAARRAPSISRRRTGTQVTAVRDRQGRRILGVGLVQLRADNGECSRAPTRPTPSKDLNPTSSDEYFNAGVVSHPRKNIDVAFVYKHEKVDGGGTVSTSNGTIGGAHRRQVRRSRRLGAGRVLTIRPSEEIITDDER